MYSLIFMLIAGLIVFGSIKIGSILSKKQNMTKIDFSVEKVYFREILKKYKTNEGFKVLLDFKTFKNGFNQKLVPISYLMEKTFNPSKVTDIDTKIWDEEMDRLCKFYEKLGFVSIQDYCQFEYSTGYVYGNTIGKALAEKATKVNECF